MPHPTPTLFPAALAFAPSSATGEFCDAFGVRCYCISGAEKLPPFLINLVSASNLWMFVASNGALTAGRVDADGALFPYQTVDRIYDSVGVIGPVTACWVSTAAGEVLWEPFAAHTTRIHSITRNLYKSVEGDRLWFEEINPALGLSFRYGWSTAEEHGFIRRCELVNLTDESVSVRICDGVKNILPAGIPLRLQSMSSNLADAYKTAEVLSGSRLAVYALAATIVDQPTPMEALRASVVWSGGLSGAAIHVSDQARDAFNAGQTPQAKNQSRGVRCAYLLTVAIKIKPRKTEHWFMVADTGLSQANVTKCAQLQAGPDPQAVLVAATTDSTNLLRSLVGDADGTTAHHFANVLFNVLRGGTFIDGYLLPTADFVEYVARHNRAAADRHARFLHDLPASLARTDLLALVMPLGDTDFTRLTVEYLPLIFSRRHGDPSRPWNKFSIRLKDSNGKGLIAYEGNWRDIFQNWEALNLSYPEYFDAVIAKFLSASTADGYNPYRISQAGIDWETPDPEDPWSSIGYWGDHQVVYLLKLLEWSARFNPAAMPTALRQARYSYADVPYQIADYAALRRNPRDTITFVASKHRATVARISQFGSDARLISTPAGEVLHVNLTEKMLVLVLVRLSNFIPGAGIWMNTQRPEWNDANNALVGYGVSVVTLCYLRRFMAHGRSILFTELGADSVLVSNAVVVLLQRVHSILGFHEQALNRVDYSPAERRELVDALASAGGDYRAQLYATGPGPSSAVAALDIIGFFDRAQQFVDHSVRANLRSDGLIHSYNQLEFTEFPAGLVLKHLPLMLEGQVAVLSSGVLSIAETVDLLVALRGSALYRADQHSYTLYPDRNLAGFLGRNIIDPSAWKSCPLFNDMFVAGEQQLVLRDAAGCYRFNADLVNGDALEKRLDQLAAHPRWKDGIKTYAERIREIYEEVFRHRAFTGRSGSMFGFEGLGSIYWHMVAKLLLAVQENIWVAQAARAPETTHLIELYYDVRAGLGFNKSPAKYGAFPTDPYSHTPGHSGAQQPGMTGQVKEEILTRLGELGVHIEEGILSFRPTLLRAGEFTNASGHFRVIRSDQREHLIPMTAQTLGFTYAGAPIVYRRESAVACIKVFSADGGVRELPGHSLDHVTSASIFARDGSIDRIEVELGSSYRPL
jgi:hypothetical protein